MTFTRSSMSRDLARQLMARESADASNPGAIQLAVKRVSDNLCHAVGDDGCNALLSRVHTNLNGDHPALATILLVTVPPFTSAM